MDERKQIFPVYGLDRLIDEKLTVVEGWDQTLAAQLVEASREPGILKHTPRDSSERFRNIDSANEWYDQDKNRIIYALAKTSELAGIIWFSNKSTLGIEADYTFAIRMYEIARGKGLSEIFARTAISDFEHKSGYSGDIWLETDADNMAAMHLYDKLGYKTSLQADGRVTMVRSSETKN